MSSAHSKKSAANHETAPHAKGNHAMTTHSKPTVSHKPTSAKKKEGDHTMSVESTESVSPVLSPTIASTGAAATSTTAASATAKTPLTSLGAGLLPAPPDVTIPSPPQGFEPTTGIAYRGIVPWTAELVILPKALQDLARFTSYASVLGTTVPPYSQLVEILTVGSQWSATRAASSAWDMYCRDQEGSAWRLINALMDRLRPAFALAVQGDASIASTYPSLAELLSVKKVNARKGVSTRQLNKQAKAKGEPETHGVVGKKREKRAAKAALAAANAAAAGTSQQPPVVAAPVTPAAVNAAPKPAGQ